MKCIPQVYDREVDVVRICEYVSYSFDRLQKTSPEFEKVERVKRILTKFPPAYVEKYGFSRASILLPVVGICLNYWEHKQGKAIESLRSVSTGSFGAMLDTMQEVFNESELHAKHPNPEARRSFDAFIAAARAAGEKVEEPEVVSDDDLCAICYACSVDTKFVPCGHTICHMCAERMMVDNPVCHICRSHIDSLVCISFFIQLKYLFKHNCCFVCRQESCTPQQSTSTDGDSDVMS